MDKVKKYLATSKALQEKYNEIKRINVVLGQIILPPKHTSKKESEEIIETFQQYLDEPFKKTPGPWELPTFEFPESNTPKTDNSFGIYLVKNKMYMGDSVVNIENDYITLEKTGDQFENTPGLWELLTLSYPENYTNEDLNNYEDMVLLTNSYLRGNKPGAALKRTAGYKYKYFIEPLLQKLRPPPVEPPTNEDDVMKMFEQYLDAYNEPFKKTPGPWELPKLEFPKLDVPKTDDSFGIRYVKDELYIGDSPVHFENDFIILEKTGEKFENTPGLWELLTLAYPENYTEDDLNDFEYIVLTTNSYRRNNKADSPHLKRTTGYKYNNFIKPLLFYK